MHTMQMGRSVAEHQYPFRDIVPLNDLEVSPGLQGTAGDEPPSTATHHVPPPLSFPQISVFSSYWSYRPF